MLFGICHPELSIRRICNPALPLALFGAVAGNGLQILIVPKTGLQIPSSKLAVKVQMPPSRRGQAGHPLINSSIRVIHLISEVLQFIIRVIRLIRVNPRFIIRLIPVNP